MRVDRSRSPARRRRARCRWRPKPRRATRRSSPRTARRSTRRWLRFPTDEEFWLQRGQAESPDPAERGQGSVAGSVRFYEKALALAPDHFAAHHYLTHAYENSGRVQEALTQGATYAKMAPDVPHARHMHGHDLRRVGRIDEAIAEFDAADALETAYFAAEQIPVEYDWHYQHNLDLLATSYQYVGQMAKAEELFKRVVRDPVVARWCRSSTSASGRCSCWRAGRANEALGRRGRWPAHRSPVVSAAGHVESGTGAARARAVQGGGRRGATPRCA